MYGMMSDGAEYLNSPEFKKIAAEIGATSVSDVLNFLNGKSTQQGLIAATGKGLNAATFGQMPKTVGRFAGSKPVRMALRAVPGLATAGTILGAADVIAGDESLGNKVMDGAAMMAAGAAGTVLGGPLGGMIGANVGKALSDGTQALFGGGKSAEERRMEEALAALRGGAI